MQYKLAAVLLAIASLESALAHPSHGHQHVHLARSTDEVEKRQDWSNPDYYKGVDFAAAYSRGQAAQSSTTSSAPAASSSPASYSGGSTGGSTGGNTGGSSSGGNNSGSGSGSSSSGGSTSEGGAGWAGCSQTQPKAGATQDEYTGNVGSPYGCNIKTISDSDASSFQYTCKFESSASSPRKIAIWNVAGSDGQPLSGKSLPPAQEFTLQPGSTQTVAFAPDSIVNFCDWTDGETNSNDGAKKCAYVEAEFGNQENGGWSGYDVSNIQNVGGTCGVSVQAANGPVSSCTQNCYTTSNQAVGGVGGNLAPGNVQLTAKISDPSPV